jgi:cytochrome c peroxidase
MKKAGLIILLLTLVFLSCKKSTDDSGVVKLTPYTIVPPAHFPTMNIPTDNQPCVEKIRLGRMLYYDPQLSNDGRYCAQCHKQSLGFTQSDLYQNSMPVLPHVNLAWYTNYMWDGSEKGTLEDLMLFEVKDFFKADLNKINNIPKYKALFKSYFGVSQITYKELSYALAQFTRTMISKNSKYDQYLMGQVSLTYDEEMGRQIFFTEKGDCFHCHTNPLLSDNLMHNTGLDSLYKKDADKGYYNVTKNPLDYGKFRSANLHNVALRSRFMHDGRFTSLEEVIDFYDHGMRKVSNLDPIMTKPAKVNGLKLTDQDKFQLIQFLKTFTDTTYTTDTSFSAL